MVDEPKKASALPSFLGLGAKGSQVTDLAVQVPVENKHQTPDRRAVGGSLVQRLEEHAANGQQHLHFQSYNAGLETHVKPGRIDGISGRGAAEDPNVDRYGGVGS